MALVASHDIPHSVFAAFGAPDAYDVLREALMTAFDQDRMHAAGEARLVVLSNVEGSLRSVTS